jgi:hypothetical protein
VTIERINQAGPAPIPVLHRAGVAPYGADAPVLRAAR